MTDPIERLIFRTTQMLDAEDFNGFMAHCDEHFEYRITTHSPELGKDMVWLEHDRTGMQGLFKNLPLHVRMRGRFKRHVSIYDVSRQTGTDEASVVSSVLLVFTDESGVSRLFAAGAYNDTVIDGPDGPRLARREVVLDTRDLSPGMHVPV